MTYSDFLNALMLLSMKVYPKCSDPSESFARFIEEKMKGASRRDPVNLTAVLADPEIRHQEDLYSEALSQIVMAYGW
jgi:hypothetical protein